MRWPGMWLVLSRKNTLDLNGEHSMAVLVRITDFTPNTLIESQEMDDELNQLVNLLSGVSTDKDTLLKYSHATDPVLRVDQLGAGVIQRWLQNSTQKAVVNNDGSFAIGTPGASPTVGRIIGPTASGSNIAGANLELAGGPGTGNAAQGVATFRYPLTTASGSGAQGLSTADAPAWASLFIRNNGDVTVANTTTETSILGAAQANSSKVIEAGMARVGRVFWLRIWGAVGTTGTPTLQIRLKFGSTTIADTGTVTMANNTSGVGNLYVEALVTVRAVGASGTAHVFPLRISYGSANGAAINSFAQVAAPTVDFTAAQTFDLTAQWSAASASNTITAAHALIDIGR